MVGKSRYQVCETAGHFASLVGKQWEKNAAASVSFVFLTQSKTHTPLRLVILSLETL